LRYRQSFAVGQHGHGTRCGSIRGELSTVAIRAAEPDEQVAGV